MEMSIPKDLRGELASEMTQAGIPVPKSESDWAKAEDALK